VLIESGQYKEKLGLTVEDALIEYKKSKLIHDKHSYPHINNAINGLGWHKADSITSSQLVTYRNTRLKTHSPQTVKHELSMVLRSLKWARDELGYTDIDVPTVNMPSIPIVRNRRVTQQEEIDLLNALRFTNNVQQIVSLAIETGMRRSEIINMRWPDIKFKSRTLQIPKTKTGVPRTIPLTLKAVRIFNSLQRNINGVVFDISADSVSHAFKRACKRAGIDDLRFHDLRHEAVTRFFEMGLNVMEVAAISGHRDLRMLQRYTHLKAEDLARKIG